MAQQGGQQQILTLAVPYHKKEDPTQVSRGMVWLDKGKAAHLQ